MPIEIRPVLSKQDFRSFLKVPFNVYQGQAIKYSSWVPPLNIDMHHLFNRKKNAFFDHGDLQEFLAWEKGHVVGRIVAIIDHAFCQYQKKTCGFWGFFESLDQKEIAQALLYEAEQWLKSKGITEIIGPIHGSTNKQIGNQIDSFDTLPVIEMPYAPPYYAAMYESQGYKKEKDIYSYKMDVASLPLSPKIERVAEIAQKRHKLEIRTVDMKNWDKELAIVRQIWDEAWANNWGYTPWHESEFNEMAKGLKMIIIPELTFFAYVDGEPAGFSFPIPDINPTLQKINGKLFPFGIFNLLSAKNKAKILRVAAFGVRQKFQKKGIDALFVAELYARSRKRGFLGAEFSWILEENLDLRHMLEKWGAQRYRTHRIYSKSLGT